jgi:hypothetical protein
VSGENCVRKNFIICPPHQISFICSKQGGGYKAGHVTRMGKNSNVWMMLIKPPKGKRRLGKPRSKWEHNIKINLKEKQDVVSWIHLAVFIGPNG